MIARGLFVPPIKLGYRSVAWPEHEIDVMNAAVIAGKSEEEIREIVSQLVAARASAVSQVHPEIDRSADQPGTVRPSPILAQGVSR